MTRTFNYLAALALAGVALPATAVTQAEVDEARNECRQHKLMVQDKGSFAKDEDKRAWEKACGHATALMDELTGKQPATVASAPPAEAAASGEAAAFEAPAGTTSAYHHFSQENLKRQAAGTGMTASMEAPAAAASPATAPTTEPTPGEEAAAAESAPPANEPAATAPEQPAPPPAAETAALETSQAPAGQAGQGQGAGPDEAVLAPSAPPEGPPQEDEAEEEAPYIPPGP